MLNYLIRRLLYMVPILFGVMFLTFVLFNVVNTPLQMAYRIRGPKASQQDINNWLQNHGYLDEKGNAIPTFLNVAVKRTPEFPWVRVKIGERPFDSLYFRSMKRFATFDLGTSFATDEPVSAMLKRGAIPSLCITLPAFVVGLFLAVGTSLLLVFVRDSLIDRWGTVLCVAGMSIPITVYVIFGQWMAANLFHYFPAFGFNLEGLTTLRFIALPVTIMILSGVGADVRMYRAIFLEEVRADYIRTAQAKGASHARVLLVHMLKNGAISLITLVVAALPFLIMGTLVLESFFGIPGLGNLMTNAITTSDFGVIQADVYLGSLLYLFGLLLTDLCYAAADPRIRLQ
ncbi:MAG: ABC transporter permease [Chthoniobacteraceae bacterium]|nr:ABC transporter permease [Chthoniobacteraceae bacterium]